MNEFLPERKKILTEFQKSLGDTIILLLELKNRVGISQSDKIEIDNIVAKQQEILREIPDLVSHNSFEKVFSVIRKLVGLWIKLYGD